ncbi:hypothetical protein PCASD_12007 [Puccinia coronata f. sp. avenae]|uniref:Uncharacterized protein n=1 Tax=Puccinia coronata f. sp. avenae TaxID=200324 RepID=A0A2N5TBM3_9BASI|nr:hypothetical protein PCASD_12007 [Puccinia coronata f. sp. avenae]
MVRNQRMTLPLYTPFTGSIPFTPTFAASGPSNLTRQASATFPSLDNTVHPSNSPDHHAYTLFTTPDTLLIISSISANSTPHPNSSVGSKRSAFPISPNLYIAEARKDLSCVSGTFRIGRRAHLAGHLSGWDYASGMPIVNVFNASLIPFEVVDGQEAPADVVGTATEPATAG